MIRALLLCAAACGLFLLAHVAVFHRRRILRRFRALLRQFLAVALGYGLACRFLPPEPVDLLSGTVGLLLYGAFFLGYLEFYFTADRSITVRMLREIRKSPEGALTIGQFKVLFDTEEQIFRRRFREMTQSGYLRPDGDRYRLTSKGAFVGALYDRVIRFLNLEGG